MAISVAENAEANNNNNNNNQVSGNGNNKDNVSGVDIGTLKQRLVDIIILILRGFFRLLKLKKTHLKYIQYTLYIYMHKTNGKNI